MSYLLYPKSRYSIQLLTVSFIVLLVLIAMIASENNGILVSRVCSLGDLFHSKQCASDYMDSSVSILALEGDSKLGIASAIYVVSLERRMDRRSRMDKLRRFLSIDWAYYDALDKQDRLVDQLTHFVKTQRLDVNATFVWPAESDEDGSGTLFSALGGNDWTNETVDFPLLCAIGDNTIPYYSNASVIPFQMILSRGMIACWYSHLRLLMHIVNETRHVKEESWDGLQGVSIVFEDDIDVEVDISNRLTKMWGVLPRNWDLVMLGHCWSNETTNPPLTPDSPLHPSHKPKCTHGYVVSPFGARRLLTLLSYPPFAFSRALDQAIAHLIQTQYIRSFSVTPSIVIQRRCPSGEDCEDSARDSDIWVEDGHRGSKWKETLVSSALDAVEREPQDGRY